ncbi:dihydrolipoamide acetyltransferase family protein [Spirochaetia bacterium 38H-sp]|uniref:Dihydrolipoamide acetyltransferase component of pyruvate dehydrogenase complex n=1 Tax=Rarispira pelagica TaxID=3141764 RepID=A0ABU9UD77_9SPIR
MAEKILMIALSPTMEEGTIVEWHKKEGDNVETGDVICEVETDKATMDYESSQSGTLLRIIKQQGDKARVGEAIAIIGEEKEDITEILKEIENEKINPAPQEKKAKPAEKKQESETVEQKHTKPREEAPPASKPPTKEEKAPPTPGRIKASPLARKKAKEMGVDLRSIRGSGPDGRITVKDIENAKAITPQASLSNETKRIKGGIIPVSTMRATIAKRLSESKFTAPHFSVTISATADRLLNLRESINSKAEKKLSLNSFLIKLSAEALVRHPAILSSWEEENIRLFDTADIALAVALTEGLITPVVRSAESKTISEIDYELTDLIQRAKTSSLTPEEYTQAGFTISNLGSYGVEEFDAIINPPGSAILAVGAIKTEPIYDGETFRPAKIIRLTLSCDHRTIDGALAADFMRTLKAMIEEPAEALI